MHKYLLYGIMLAMLLAAASAQTDYYTLKSLRGLPYEAFVAVEEHNQGVQLRLFSTNLPSSKEPYEVFLVMGNQPIRAGVMQRNLFGIWELVMDFPAWNADGIIVQHENAAVLAGTVS